MNVGINVFIIRNGKLLLGRRNTAAKAGVDSWALPGGHLELNEKFKEAAARELMEETGMTARDFTFKNIVNMPGNPKHYIQVGFEAVDVQGEPELKEPEHCHEWKWFDISALPENLFFAHIEQIKNFLAERTFSE